MNDVPISPSPLLTSAGETMPEITVLPPVEVAGQRLTVFLESPPLVQAMMADIASAKWRVWLEAYIFVDDVAGRAISEALRERAAAGCDVRLLYDAFGSQFTSSSVFQQLEQAGVQVHAYHSLTEALRKWRLLSLLNRRNHRKLLVVDDRVAYFGGMNIVDPRDVVERQPPAGRPIALGWRDVHLRLEGDQQPELAESFERSWRQARHEPVERRPRAYRRAVLPTSAESIRFFDSGPGWRYSRAARVFTRVIRPARRRITVSMAYFLPTGRVLASLLRARRRGAAIDVVIPSRSDVWLVEMATRWLVPRLLRRGFRVFERQRRMLHSKVLVVDGRWSVVGSANLDARSLGFNLELLAVIRSRQFAALLEEVCRFEISQSRQMTPTDLAGRGFGPRLASWLAYGLRWWL